TSNGLSKFRHCHFGMFARAYISVGVASHRKSNHPATHMARSASEHCGGGSSCFCFTFSSRCWRSVRAGKAVEPLEICSRNCVVGAEQVAITRKPSREYP